MARSRRIYPIMPFPSTLNRTHFASWLSGFTDGEGCSLPIKCSGVDPINVHSVLRRRRLAHRLLNSHLVDVEC